jgi:3'-phosphoadenosine 5'-phosphosulfate sulfotransferase (PAPS reductase)/FAD synthetase
MTESELKNLFLRQRQSLPIQIKIQMTEKRIRQWYEMWDGNVHVSFSGGADSTVLLRIARKLYPDIPAVFVDTGVEFPEIREFVRTIDNVVWLKPKKTFKQVCEEYGYPVVSKETAQKLHEVRTTQSEFLLALRTTGVEGRKRQEIPRKWKFLLDAPFKCSHKCCDVLKKEPQKRYEKATGSKAITGVMASESSVRTQKLIKSGCFSFGDRPTLNPMAFWTSADTRRCLKVMPHCSLYDRGFDRTGCMFCCFGVHMNNPNKFQILKETHPRLHRLGIPAFGLDKVLDYMGVPWR